MHNRVANTLVALNLLLCASACGTAPTQVDVGGVAPSNPDGAVVRIKNIKGKYPDVTGVILSMDVAHYDVPMHPLGGDVWEAQLTSKQAHALPVAKYGFRTYRAHLKITSKDPAGKTDTASPPITITLS